MSNTAHLIQQLLGNTDEVINVNDLRHAAAKELERLTQPVEVGPIGWRLQHTKHEVGVTSYNLEQMQDYVTDGWEVTNVIYSAETVARLIAERDEFDRLHTNQMHTIIALQTQVKKMSALMSIEQLAKLAATEPKEK